MTGEPWLTTDPDPMAWTTKAFELAQAGKYTVAIRGARVAATAFVNGPCPRCAEDVDWSTPLRALTPDPGGIRTLQTPGTSGGGAGPVRLDVICECDGDHPGRPATILNGCGVAFRLIVRLSS